MGATQFLKKLTMKLSSLGTTWLNSTLLFQQILELQKQLNELQQQQQVQAYSLQREMLLEQQKFEHEKEMEILKARIDKNDPQEIMKADAEITKAQLDVEKAAVELKKEEIGGLV